MEAYESPQLFVDSHGTELYFAGFYIGGLVRFNATPSSCSPNEVTHMGAVVVGSGLDSRVVRAYEPGPIEPGTVSVEILGSPAYSAFDAGMVGDLALNGPWGGVNFPAFITKVTLSGAAGDIVRSTWEFQLI